MQVESILSNFFIDAPGSNCVLESSVKKEEGETSVSPEKEGLLSISPESPELSTAKLVPLLQRHERSNFPEKNFYLSEKMDFSQISLGEQQAEKLKTFLTDLRNMGSCVAVKYFWEDSQQEIPEVEGGGEGEAIVEEATGGQETEDKPSEKVESDAKQGIEEERTDHVTKIEKGDTNAKQDEAGVEEATHTQSVPIVEEGKEAQAPTVGEQGSKSENQTEKEEAKNENENQIAPECPKEGEEDADPKSPAESAKSNPKAKSASKGSVIKSQKSNSEDQAPNQGTQEEQVEEDFQRMLAQSTTDINPNKKLSLPTKIAGSDPLPLHSRSFFGSHHFYNFFSFFTVLFERLKLAKTKSQNIEAYEFFKQILSLRIAGALDPCAFDDMLSCLFGEISGVMMNFEKILTGVAKEVPVQELDKFVINLNKQLFRPESGRPDVYPLGCNAESEIFVQTCYKIGSSSGRNRQTFKHAQNYGRQESKGEDDYLLKFEYRSDQNAFVIHKVKSIYKNGMKQSCKNTLSEFVKNSNDFFCSKGGAPNHIFSHLPENLKACLASSDTTRTPPSPVNESPRPVLSFPGKKCYVKNEIQYEFGMRYHELKAGPSRKEDLMFSFRGVRTEQEKEDSEQKRLRKVLKFREMLARRLDKKDS